MEDDYCCDGRLVPYNPDDYPEWKYVRIPPDCPSGLRAAIDFTNDVLPMGCGHTALQDWGERGNPYRILDKIEQWDQELRNLMIPFVYKWEAQYGQAICHYDPEVHDLRIYLHKIVDDFELGPVVP